MLGALRPLLSLLLATWLGIASLGGAVFGTLVYFPRAWLTFVGWDSLGVALILIIGLFWVWQPMMLVIGVLLKWMLVGKRRSGVHVCRYPLCEKACTTYHAILSDFQGNTTPYILNPPSLTSLYLRLCGAEIGRRVIIRDPINRVVQADLLRLGDASFIAQSASLTVQLPVRSESVSNLRRNSIFDLGEVRPHFSTPFLMCTRNLLSYCFRRQLLLQGASSRPRLAARRLSPAMPVYQQAAQGPSPATPSTWACPRQQSGGRCRVP